jgi:serine/threonine protein kinase
MTHKDSFPPTLPWFRSSNQLPGPLPSIAQIEAASIELPSIYYDAESRRTVVVNERFVAKYGCCVHENEGYAMLLVEKVKAVPTPRLYAMYREGEKLYIVMEFIPGSQLSQMWPSLSEEEKSPIISQLRQAFDSLRELPSTEQFSGAAGGPINHRWFLSLDNDPSVTGPFTTEKEFCNALVLRSERNWESYGRRGWMTEFFGRHLSTVLSGHSSVFTHPDLQRKNILVKEVGQLANGPDNTTQRLFEVTAILDWESAGWFPSYWEYADCFVWFDWADDWAEKVEQILQPCPIESPILRMIGHDLDNIN